MEQGVMNLEVMLDTIRNCRSVLSFDSFQPFTKSRTLLGMDIVESPVFTEPCLKLSSDAPVSDEFRREFDAWLLEMFGLRDITPQPRGTAYVFGHNLIVRADDRAWLNCVV